MQQYLRTMLVILVIQLSFSCKKEEIPNAGATTWAKENSNPVLKRGAPFGFDFLAISDCWVLVHNGLYKMWYTGGGAVYPDTLLHSSIGYATSTDGIHWTKYAANPVLDINANGWDSLGVETASVLIDSLAPEQSRYKLWYAGQTYNDHRYEIGYAFSGDGIHWTKHPAQVLKVGNAGDWDNCFLEGPTVLKEGNTYKMWYSAYDCEINNQSTDGKVTIGYATSPDGIHWTKYAKNPVLTTSNSQWDAQFVQDPHVLYFRERYHMWYGGTLATDNFHQQTGYAYSSDGINWTKSSSNPVLRKGPSGNWDANTASFPSVIIAQDKLKLWYTGKDVHPLPEWPSPFFWELGYAEKEIGSGALLD